MILNKSKFINALASVEITDNNKKRKWDTFYKNNVCAYWNNELWKKILESEFINGNEINKYEFLKFCSNYCTEEKSKSLFNKINQRSNSINFLEFEDFLEKIDAKDYNKILNSLEKIEKLENIKESNINYEKFKKNTELNIFDLKLDKEYNKKKFRKFILNCVFSPHDTRDWLYDNFLNETDYSLPLILDYRDSLLPVRNQGNQGSCFAMSVACMKEFQEKLDYGLNEYLSPQFFYNIRDNLYDNNKNNDKGMYGRNVMKLLMKYGICTEKLYPYGRIQYKDKISEYCFKEAKNHKIKGYCRVLSIKALKYSLKYNGLCLIVFPIYNYTPELWIKDENEKILGGHAMTVVGYLENCFIIRNSWGTDWGDNGYSYYFFSDWGIHWEIWTTIDKEYSKQLKSINYETDSQLKPVYRPLLDINNSNEFLHLKDIILNDNNQFYVKPLSTTSSQKKENSERDKELDLELKSKIIIKPINIFFKLFKELFKEIFKNIKKFFNFIINY